MKSEITDYKAINSGKLSHHQLKKNKEVERLTLFDYQTNEHQKEFFSYLDRIGLEVDDNLVVLYSAHHYFYNADELKKAEIVINFKLLNHIRELKNFINTIYRLLPLNSNLIGCFEGKSEYPNAGLYKKNKEIYENGIESRIPFINRMYTFLDFKTYHSLNEKVVRQILKECGFTIYDMTEINGLNYFCAKKVKTR